MSYLSRNIFAAGLIILMFSGLSIVTHHQGFALRLLNLSFWIFVVGVIIYLMETIKDEA